MSESEVSRGISVSVASPSRSGGSTHPETIHAVIIGVGHFQQQEIKPIAGARKDAMDFCNLLLEFGVPPGQIVSLLDERATRENVEAAFREIPRNSSASLIVYLATHGVLHRDAREKADGYVLLHDSLVHGDFPEGGRIFVETPPNAFSTGEFLKRVHATPPRPQARLGGCMLCRQCALG